MVHLFCVRGLKTQNSTPQKAIFQFKMWGWFLLEYWSESVCQSKYSKFHHKCDIRSISLEHTYTTLVINATYCTPVIRLKPCNYNYAKTLHCARNILYYASNLMPVPETELSKEDAPWNDQSKRRSQQVYINIERSTTLYTIIINYLTKQTYIQN